MSMIIDKAWKDKRNTPKIHIAYAISVCQIFLNPNNLIINMSEEVVMPLFTKNYVSFRKTLMFRNHNKEVANFSVKLIHKLTQYYSFFFSKN
jgi:hypothetical protein